MEKDLNIWLYTILKSINSQNIINKAKGHKIGENICNKCEKQMTNISNTQRTAISQ